MVAASRNLIVGEHYVLVVRESVGDRVYICDHKRAVLRHKRFLVRVCKTLKEPVPPMMVRKVKGFELVRQ